MAQAIQRERIEMRVDANTKQLAERASAASGCSSLSEFVTRLILENAPKILESKATIQATNEQFDHFIAVCQDTERKPSDRIMEASKRLDAEGY